jgi:3-keto-5-aminohexanoate cleavage enzyme
MSAGRKVIITAALTGAVTTREHTPHVPLTADEIADDARRCADAGASVVHLHLRTDEENRPNRLNIEGFARMMAAVRAKSKAVVCLSTSCWGAEGGIADRVAGLATKPELASFHVGSFNRGEQLFHNPVEYQEALAEACLKHHVKPEFELFDLTHVYRALQLHERYRFPGPFYGQFVLGVRGGCPAEPRHLQHLVDTLPPGAEWSVAAVGAAQLPSNLLGLILGGHIRTGLEDNVYLRKGVLASGNAELVERLARLTRELGLDVASPEEARQRLGLVGP